MVPKVRTAVHLPNLLCAVVLIAWACGTAATSALGQAPEAQKSDAAQPDADAPKEAAADTGENPDAGESDVAADDAKSPPVPRRAEDVRVRLMARPDDLGTGRAGAALGRAKALVEATQDAASADEKAERLIAAANAALAAVPEPACSRLLHGLPPFEKEPLPATDIYAALPTEHTVRDVLTLTRGWLAHAETLLEESTGEAEEGGAEDEIRRSRLWAAVSALSPLNAAIEEVLFPSDKPDASRAAASGLAALLESDDARVASVATLWQAVLRAREDDADAVLTRLPLALETPDRETTEFGFFERLFRIRVVADRVSPAVAQALALQMEERSFDWFRRSGDRSEALVSIALVRLITLQAWHNAIDETRDPDAKAWTEERMELLIVDHFAAGEPEVFRLPAAVPILVPMPEALPSEPED